MQVYNNAGSYGITDKTTPCVQPGPGESLYEGLLTLLPPDEQQDLLGPGTTLPSLLHMFDLTTVGGWAGAEGKGGAAQTMKATSCRQCGLLIAC